MADRIVRYILTGESTGAVRAMQNTERSADKTATALEKTGRSMQSVGSSLATVGKTMMMASLPFLAAGGYSIRAAMDFDKSMNLIQTQAGASEKQVKQLTKGILGMKGVDQTPQELADGMFHVVSAMNASLPASQRVTDELAIQKQAAIGAAVGHSNLEQTTYALVSAMNAIHAPANQARTVMSELNAAVGAGDLRMEELVAAMGTGYLARANAFGISLQSANSALDTMTQKGVPAEQSATRLAMAFSLLGAPTNQAAKLLEATGLASNEVAAKTQAMSELLAKGGMHTTQLAEDLRKPNGIMVALRDLKTHLEMAGLSAPEQGAFISRAFGGGRMSGGILTLYQNLPAMAANYNNQLRITGQYGADYKKTSEEAAFKWDLLKQQVDKTAITVGNELLPSALSFAKVIGGVLEDVSKLPPWIVEGTMFGAAGFFGLGALGTMTGGALKGLGTLAGIPSQIGRLFGVGGAAAGETAAVDAVSVGSASTASAASGGIAAALAAMPEIIPVALAAFAAYEAYKHIHDIDKTFHKNIFGTMPVETVYAKGKPTQHFLSHAPGKTAKEQRLNVLANLYRGYEHDSSLPARTRERGEEDIIKDVARELGAHVHAHFDAQPIIADLHHETKLDGRVIAESTERFILKRQARQAQK